MKTVKFHISAPSTIVSALDSRGARSTIISRDLERLYTMYERALRRISLSVEEACLIVDALNGTINDLSTAARFWIGVQDAIELEGFDQKWQVDGDALIKKLQELDEITALAIVDAAERFWESQSEDIREAVKKLFYIR